MKGLTCTHFILFGTELHTLVNDEFEDACEFVAKADIGDTNVLLKLYGLYKFVREGECKKPKPGIFDFEGRAKWDSWKSCSALTTEDACSEYVACVKENTNWGQDTEADGKAKGKGSSTGVSVSVMEWEGPIVSDEDKTVFDWVAEGDVEKLKKLVTVNIIRELVDDNGLTLLHWASDRGNVDIAKYLLANNANVNGQDNDGMTPLHYAAINGHMELAKVLLDAGADEDIQDGDGKAPSDYGPLR